MSASVETSNPEALLPLSDAYAQVMAFDLAAMRDNELSTARLNEAAASEASYGQVMVDKHGITSGMRIAILNPLEEATSRWRALGNRFNIALQPFKESIDGIRDLEQQLVEIKVRKDEKLQAVEDDLKSDSRYHNIDENYQRSRQRYNMFRDKHKNRAATMFCKKWPYPFLLALVLLTECFVNFHAFNMFWGVPAVALGTTIILGVLLALAAHLHGEIIKQWSYLFAPSRLGTERASAWRMFSISTTALVIVLGFTGWARWAAAMESIHGQDGGNILGPVGLVQVNPMRDVFISLIANLGAWMVGVIISYAGHDSDPEYMVITKQFQGHQREWEKMQSAMKARRLQITAAAEKEREEKESTVQTRTAAVKTQIDMARQVQILDQSLESELWKLGVAAAEVYRDALLALARSGREPVSFVSKENASVMSPLDFKSAKIALEAA